MTARIRPTMLASLTLGILDLSRARAWGSGGMGHYDHVGALGAVPSAITVALWLIAGLAMLASYWSVRARIIGVSLTAALHASVAVSALVAYLHPGAEVLESTIGSYGAIAALTLLTTRMTDNRTVLEGRHDSE